MTTRSNALVPQRSNSMVKSFDALSNQYYPGQGWNGDKAVQVLSEELRKATGIATYAPGGIGGTQALMLENLDMTMTEVLITEAFMKMFTAIPRVPSKNALYEWTRKLSYGSFRGTAGFREGGAPNGSQWSHERKTATIRYLGERGGLTHQLTVAGAAGGTQIDPVAEENRNTAVRLLAKCERAIVRGREDILDDAGVTVNYNGIIPQMKALYPRNVIDMKGEPITFGTLDELAYDAYDNAKLLNFSKIKGFATGFILSDLGSMLRQTERSTLTGSGKPGLVPGTPFGSYQSQFGNLSMDASQFLDEVEGDRPVAVADAGAPAATAGVTGTPGANADSLIPAGSYYYFASAINSNGESLTVASAAVTVGAGEGVTVAITRVNAATGYRLYRGTTDDETAARWIATVAQPGSGNASYVDLNQKVPGTGTVIFFHQDPADIALPQLAPLVKWPLAIVNTTVEFLLLLYHTLAIKAPERVWVYENVGRYVPV